jgi:hypothetical protein
MANGVASGRHHCRACTAARDNRADCCVRARPPAIYYLKQPHQMPFESSNYPRSSQDTAASCFPGAHPFFRKLLLRAPGMLNSPCFIFSCARRFYFFRPSSKKMLDSDEINFSLKRRSLAVHRERNCLCPNFCSFSLSLSCQKRRATKTQKEELKRAENLILMGETEAEGSSIIIYKEPSLLIFNLFLAHTHTPSYIHLQLSGDFIFLCATVSFPLCAAAEVLFKK